MDFLKSPADIVIYGGMAGSGKSYALLMEPLKWIRHIPGYGGVIFRRLGPQITNEGGLWDTSKELYYKTDARPRENSLDWLFTVNGSQKPNRLKFASMQYEKDKYQWQGSQIPYIGWDELTHFERSQFMYLLSRNRSTCGIKPCIKATTNPDANSWVKELIQWYLDPNTGLAIPERSGVIRYFVVIDDDFKWASDPEELIYEYGDYFKDGIEEAIMSFTFINASIHDNKILLKKDPGYLAKLHSLPKVERERLLGGNWNITEEDGLVSRDWWNLYDYPPDDLRDFIWSWDLAARDKTWNDYTVGGLWARNDSGHYLIKMVRFKKKYPEQKKAIQEQFEIAEKEGYDIKEILIEDKSNGIVLIDELKSTTTLPIIAINPKTDKIARVNACSSDIEAGNVFLPRNDGYTKIFINEWSQFPPQSSSGHDDIVDMTTQYLNRVKLRKQVGFTEKQINERPPEKTTIAPKVGTEVW